MFVMMGTNAFYLMSIVRMQSNKVDDLNVRTFNSITSGNRKNVRDQNVRLEFTSNESLVMNAPWWGVHNSNRIAL